MLLLGGRVRSAALAGSMLVALVGCVDAEQPTVVPTVTVGSTTTVTVTAETTPMVSEITTTQESREPVPVPVRPTHSETMQWRTVDSEDFLAPEGSGYYFVSPSRNLNCAIFDWSEDPLAGCQAWSLVDNLPECDDPMVTSSPAIDFYRGEAAIAYCIAEGAFSYEGAPVLEYGEQLRVAGIVCQSLPGGVTCYDDGSGRGFSAARAGFLPVG